LIFFGSDFPTLALRLFNDLRLSSSSRGSFSRSPRFNCKWLLRTVGWKIKSVRTTLK